MEGGASDFTSESSNDSGFSFLTSTFESFLNSALAGTKTTSDFADSFGFDTSKGFENTGTSSELSTSTNDGTSKTSGDSISVTNSYIELLTIACNIAEYYQFKSHQINKISLDEMCYFIYRINKDYPAWNLKGVFPNMRFIYTDLNGNLENVYRSLQ